MEQVNKKLLDELTEFANGCWGIVHLPYLSGLCISGHHALCLDTECKCDCHGASMEKLQQKLEQYARDIGEIAYIATLPLDSNPYARNDEHLAQIWREGWLYSQAYERGMYKHADRSPAGLPDDDEVPAPAPKSKKAKQA